MGIKKRTGRRYLLYVVLLLLITAGMAGCGKKEKKDSEVNEISAKLPEPEIADIEETPSPSPSPEETNAHKGQVRSRLTGKWISKKTAAKRPIAIMLNNIKTASPQSGIAEASVLYEALTEGGITRFLGIYETVSGDRIGSVRSARHYFVSVADEYDAIFAHYGQTSYALDKIAALQVDNLSGLEAVGSTVYYRDNGIKAPHNAFASAKGILAGIEQKEYRTKVREDLEKQFAFYKKSTNLKGEAAKKITLPFSSYTTPYFTYDRKTKKYLRWQYGTTHTDRVTKKQLSYKNLIIQYVSYSNRDKNGYQTIGFENNSGSGLYLTNGRAVEITWDKKEAAKTMHYYGPDGKLLKLNPGNTYVALFPESRKGSLTISE